MSTPEEILDLKVRVKVLEDKFSQHETKLIENTILTQESVTLAKEIKSATLDLVTFSRNAQGAVNTLNWFIKIFKPFGWVGVILTAIYAGTVAVKALIVQAIAHIK